MRLHVTYRNIDPADSLRARCEKKFAKVARFLREPVEANVVLRAEKHRKIAEVTVTAAGGKPMAAHGETDDTFASIDMAMDKLERAVRRARRRVIDRNRAGEDELSSLLAVG